MLKLIVAAAAFAVAAGQSDSEIAAQISRLQAVQVSHDHLGGRSIAPGVFWQLHPLFSIKLASLQAPPTHTPPPRSPPRLPPPRFPVVEP